MLDDILPAVFANRLLPADAVGQSDGTISWRVRTARDKAQLIVDRKSLLGSPVAYIGDSGNDLGALLTADVGIVIGRSSSLLTAAAKFGVQLSTVTELLQQVEKGQSAPWELKTECKVLYLASSWDEVGRLLLV